MDYLLIDVYDNTAYDFVASRANHLLIPVRPPRYIKRKEVQWILGMLRVLRLSKRNDRLIFVFDFQAVLAWWFCHVFGMKRQFLCLNLLLDQSSSLKNRMASRLYRKALQDTCFHATVTSEAYGVWLNEALGFDVSYCLLRDVYHASYQTLPGDCSYDVFCGGRNGRDWNFFFDLAASMPDISFAAIMPSSHHHQFSGKIPENVRVFLDIPSSAFSTTLASSSVVCLPLTKQAPAGLIVLFQAAANRKPVIMSDTVSTQAYGSEGRGILLGRNLADWQNAIRFCLKNRDKAQEMAHQLLSFCEKECSEEQFVAVIDQMLTCHENPALQ